VEKYCAEICDNCAKRVCQTRNLCRKLREPFNEKPTRTSHAKKRNFRVGWGY
jgi:hypothetical protein